MNERVAVKMVTLILGIMLFAVSFLIKKQKLSMTCIALAFGCFGITVLA